MKGAGSVGLVLGALLLVGVGCGPRTRPVQATVEVELLSDCLDERHLPAHDSGSWRQMLGEVVDELRLVEQWSPSGRRLSRDEAVARLQSRVRVVADPERRRVRLAVEGVGEEECRALVGAVARRYGEHVVRELGRELAAQLDGGDAELQAGQEKLTALRREIAELQKDFFVPSGYRLSPEYESELQEKIRRAADEEAARRRQLESLRSMSREQLHRALLELETARVAAARAGTNPAAATSMLLQNERARQEAVRMLELAQQGALSETNAVAHARLRLEQAEENVAATLDAHLQSLEIELEVARTRTRELGAQLEKLRETSRRAETKKALENEARAIQSQLNARSDQLARWRLCERLMSQAVRVGEAHTERVGAR